MRRLVEGARQGDREAFERIVRQYAAMAYTVAHANLRDHYMAEDAVQEAFAEAFLHLDKLKEPEAFPGWFRTIVVRQCQRLLRRKRHPTMPYEEMDATRTDRNSAVPISLPDIAARNEMVELLHDSIAGLSPNLRIAVQLFYLHGYSLEEVSACQGTTVSAMKKRLFDARRRLKGSLPVADFISVFNDLHEGGERMLHIVNGDTVEEKLRQGVVQGDILVWREVYPEGPVFPDPAEPGHRAVRADYLEQAMGIPSAEYSRISESQEKTLANFQKYDEVILWFEHDLFDQTMLCYLLHWFAQRSLGRTKLSLLCIGAFPGIELFRGLGQLSVQQMKTLSGTWQTVGQAEMDLGKAVWEAYASPNPGELAQLLDGDTSALPFVQDAFRLHLSRFPSVRNGLGIVEQTTLEMAADGRFSPLELFEHVGNKLHGLGMGDLQYWRCLAGMSQGAAPLLTIGGLTAFPTFKEPSSSLAQCSVALTELGHNVMHGKSDWIAANSINAWYGGVHLQGHNAHWRWDSTRNTIVATQI